MVQLIPSLSLFWAHSNKFLPDLSIYFYRHKVLDSSCMPAQQLRLSASFSVSPSTDPVSRSAQTIRQTHLPPPARASAPCLTVRTTRAWMHRHAAHSWASQGARMSASLAAPPPRPAHLRPARMRWCHVPKLLIRTSSWRVHTHPPPFTRRPLVPELLAVPTTFHCIVPRTCLCTCACRRRISHLPTLRPHARLCLPVPFSHPSYVLVQHTTRLGLAHAASLSVSPPLSAVTHSIFITPLITRPETICTGG
jgi:hypothetical protein